MKKNTLSPFEAFLLGLALVIIVLPDTPRQKPEEPVIKQEGRRSAVCDFSNSSEEDLKEFLKQFEQEEKYERCAEIRDILRAKCFNAS